MSLSMSSIILLDYETEAGATNLGRGNFHGKWSALPEFEGI